MLESEFHDSWALQSEIRSIMTGVYRTIGMEGSESEVGG